MGGGHEGFGNGKQNSFTATVPTYHRQSILPTATVVDEITAL